MNPDGLDKLLDSQLAIVSRGQLLALGMKDNAIQWRVRRGGSWQVLLPGTYLGVTGVPTMAQKEVAAQLYAGPDSLITGPAALLHYSIRGPIDAIDMLIPADRQRASTDLVRIQRTTRLPEEFTASGQARIVLAPRAVADTARQLTSLRDIRAVVADAVQLGRCTLSQLGDELAQGPTRGSALFRTVLAEAADGIRSTAEDDLNDLITSAGLPQPLYHPALYDGDTFIARPDAWWPDAGVAVETDAPEWHLNPVSWQATLKRHEQLGELGLITLPLAPAQLRGEPAEVIHSIKDALESGRGRPTLLLRTVPGLPRDAGRSSALD